MRNRLSLVCLVAASVGVVYAQPMRARITGNRGEWGKCTIEVVVDGAADVEITGDSAFMRTLEGQRAEWRRMECTDPLPRNPIEFRFRGIDGRGRQELVRDPRSNRGVAVVRISDPKGGREGYTFDIEWRGSAGGGYGGPGGGGPGGGGGYGRDRDRDGGRDRNVVSCSSDDMRRHYCDADTRGGVRLLRQRSEAACREGYSWGFDRRGIWVDRGCRADFEVRR